MADLIINDQTNNDVLFPKDKGRGLIPRDYKMYPQSMFAPPSDMPLIPKSEWSDRIKEMKATKTRLSDIRDWKNFDQGSEGYCWAYSTGHCVQMVRTVNHQPPVRLNPHAVGAIIKKGRNEGGWCGLSAAFLREVGIPTEEFWPGHSLSLKNDTPAMRANASQHKVTEDWVDLQVDVYDQNLTFNQMMTCLLMRIPCALDFNHWSHSIMGIDPEEIEPGSFGPRILNSWLNWGDNGMAVLQGSKGIPDGALAFRVVTGAVV